MHNLSPRRTGTDRSHFQQLNQCAAASQDALALEQCLSFERIELDILRERVDEIFIGNRGRKPGLGAGALDSDCEQGLEAMPMPPGSPR